MNTHEPATSAEEAFLHDVAASPDDDAPRLIYADWLDDRGRHERADFIRVQCALAHLPEDDPGRASLEAVERDLLAAHRERWLAELPTTLWQGAAFARGFVAELACSARFLLLHGPRLLPRHPIQRLTMRGRPLDLRDLFAGLPLPHIRNLELPSFGIGGEGGREGLAALLVLGRLPSLRHLGLTGNRIEDDTLEWWLRVGARWQNAVQSLDLSDNAVGRRGLHILSRGMTWPALTELDLSRNRIDLPAVMSFADSSLLGQLELLDLSQNAVADSLRLLLRSQPLADLRRLYLSGTQLELAGVRELAAAEATARLTHLDLSFNPLADDAAEILADSPAFDNLRWLRVYHTNITCRGAAPRLQDRFGDRVDL